jgi:hypothetical protein
MTNTTQEVAPQVSGSQGIDSIVITDALSVIDKALAEMLRRELVSSDEPPLLSDLGWHHWCCKC